MKFAIIDIARGALIIWARLTTSVNALTAPAQHHSERAHRFPTVVAQTTEGKIMDGPRGLRLITPCGPTLVDQTPEGFIVYCPSTHILQPSVGRNHLSGKTGPTISS